MKFGFIGLGNMATAIIRGMVKSGSFRQDRFYGYNRSEEKTRALARDYLLMPCDNSGDLAEICDVVILAVKPQMLDDVMPLIAPKMNRSKLVVTIAAGKALAYYEAWLPGVPVIRVMPNMNAAVGASASGICRGEWAGEEQVALVRRMFESVGTVTELPEHSFSAFSAVAGASPAFTYLYIDAMASAAVKAGIPRAQALEIAAAAVYGSAKMLMESGEHPNVLADRVCSPGGTTIEGVLALHEHGFASAVHAAVAAVIAKDEKLRS